MKQFEKILAPYNPWWGKKHYKDDDLPDFQRPVFNTLWNDLEQIPQMLSITGPRRVGKSTLVKQIIERLIAEGTDPDNIIYYSFDDPALFTGNIKPEELIDYLMTRKSKGDSQKVHLFLDEIQKLERWELFLKKYYDLKYKRKIVISGSASSPIFKKSRESLLGRIKDYHILPFSFREYALFNLRDNPSLFTKINDINKNVGKFIRGLVKDPDINGWSFAIDTMQPDEEVILDELLKSFMFEGGFPEVWQLPELVQKQDYLYDNQIKKVIYEDLVQAAEFRKPDLLRKFYLSLLEMPGREVSVSGVAEETNINAAQIDKYLPLLEMTDLVYSINRFRTKPTGVRKGKMKFYLVDLALRNAVMRISDIDQIPADMLGLYAENLVYLALKKWKGVLQIDYFRDRGDEVDFIVHTNPGKYLPVEVKYREKIQSSHFKSIRKFAEKFSVYPFPVVVTKRWATFGLEGGSFKIPLPLFLLMFD